MKKCLSLFASVALFAGFSAHAGLFPFTKTQDSHAVNGYAWNIPTPNRVNLYTNFSGTAVSVLYSVGYNSDTVVVRCPLAYVLVPANSTYVCWLPTGETASVELQPAYFSRGASGNFSILP